MKASTRAKLMVAWDTLLIWNYVALLIGLCLVGMCAALVGWKRLDAWCAKQLEE